MRDEKARPRREASLHGAWLWRNAALWALAALALGLLFAFAALPGIAPSSDLWDYSQEARQIARGQGFTSLYTYPVFLGREGPPFPVFWRMPLYALLGAALLKLGILLPMGYLLLGAFAHALLVGLTYLLGAAAHSGRAGSWAAACALACPLLLDFYNPGMSQAPAAVLDLTVWLILLGSRGRLAAAAAALPAAAAWYLRGESLVFVPLWLWAAVAIRPRAEATPGPDGDRRPSSGGWERAATFLVVYAALCLPWLFAAQADRAGFAIRGNPMLLYTREYPGYSSSRAMGENLPGIAEYVLRHPSSFAFRYAKDLIGYLIDLLAGLGPVAIGAAFAGLVAAGLGSRPARARTAAALWAPIPATLAASLPLQILAMSALERSPRFLVPVVPIACVLLGAVASGWLGEIRSRKLLGVLYLALLLERAATVAYQRGDARRRFPPPDRAVAVLLAERAPGWPRGSLVLSDTPDWVAWNLDRPALLLPLRGQLEALLGSRATSAIWLSPAARQRNAADGDSGWVNGIERNEPVAGFEGPEILRDGSRLYTRSP